MGLARATQRNGQAKFGRLLFRRQAGHLGQEDAPKAPGVSVRTMRRWDGRYRARGDDGLPDRRLDRVSGNRIPAGTAAEVLELFDTRYHYYTAKRFFEKLVDEFGIGFSYSCLRVKLQDKGRMRTVRRRSAPRQSCRATKPILPANSAQICSVS